MSPFGFNADLKKKMALSKSVKELIDFLRPSDVFEELHTVLS